jgi:cobalt/nickel transport system permease protein
MALSETPWGPVLKRVLLALPFAALACVSNLILDRGTADIGGISISLGVLSCFSIVFRTFLCVVAVLLLVAVTPFGQLTGTMRQWRIPAIFVTLFEMTYRYISVLLEEAGSMYTAYMLRSPGKKGLEMTHMGSFVGQLLLRSFDRADRIFAAMKCRGYDFHASLRRKRPLRAGDAVYICCTVVPCILLRAFDATKIFDYFGGLL